MGGKFVEYKTAGGQRVIVNTEYIVTLKPHQQKPDQWTEIFLTTESIVVDRPFESAMLRLLGGWTE